MDINNSNIKRAYEYNVSVIKPLEKLLEPLKEFDLGVCYMKIFSDNSYISLSNNLEIQKDFFLSIIVLVRK